MSKPVISPVNQPTFLAVTFILVIINLAITAYNFKQIYNVAAFYGAVAVKNASDIRAAGGDQNLADLEARLAALEVAAKPAEVVPAPAAPAEPAPAPK